MTRAKDRDFDFATDTCFVAYDASSGEIVATHEFLSERGAAASAAGYPASDEEDFRKRVTHNLPKRSIKVLSLPEGRGLEPDAEYWVDPECGELRVLPKERSRAARAEQGHLSVDFGSGRGPC